MVIQPPWQANNYHLRLLLPSCGYKQKRLAEKEAESHVLFPQWAFGVTLWELMTLGQTPYVDIDPFEMSAYLKDGYRIAQPINCPDELCVD